ncbi:hypothetical protein ILUMI_05754, partial [Ignelater luminosus]
KFNNTVNNTSATSTANNSIMNHTSQSNTYVLLSTALVDIKINNNEYITVGCLLDSASQGNMITQELCNKLNPKTTPVKFCIRGIGNVQSEVKTETNVRILFKHSNFFLDLSCLVLPQITDKIPSISFPSTILEIPDDLRLADLDFNQAVLLPF